MTAEIHHLADHQAVICSECGSVTWNVLRSGLIECSKCGHQRELPDETLAAAIQISDGWKLVDPTQQPTVTHGR